MANTIGTNFLQHTRRRVMKHMKKKAGMSQFTRIGASRSLGGNSAQAAATSSMRRIAWFEKDGAPATNTTGDEPSGLGDICYDYTNADVYRCTAYTNTTTFTWTKIVD